MFSLDAYFPLLLEDKEKDIEERTLILQSLPDNERDFIVSDFVTFSLETIEKKFGVSNETVQTITRTLRKFYFKEISREEVFSLLAREEIIARHPQRNDIFSFIDTNLLSYIIPAGYVERTFEEASLVSAPQKNIAPLSLKKAMEKYPRISGQRITDADIEFRGSDGPVVPNVKNWITAYHQETGPGSHEPFERSQFLFHNKNALRLSQQERNVLSEILRSLDEESALPIDTDTQTIHLLNLGEGIGQQTTSAPQEKTPPQNAYTLKKENIPPKNEMGDFSLAVEREEEGAFQREALDERKDAWREPSWQKTDNPQPITHNAETSVSQNIPRSVSPVSSPVSAFGGKAPRQLPTSNFNSNDTQALRPRSGPATSQPEISSFVRQESTSRPTPSLSQAPNISQGLSFIPRQNPEFTPPLQKPAPIVRGTAFSASPSAPESITGNTGISRAPFVSLDQTPKSKFFPPQRESQSQTSFAPQKETLKQEPQKKEDYTDYYPIPSASQSTQPSIASRLSFSSTQKFGVEKESSQHTTRKEGDSFDPTARAQNRVPSAPPVSPGLPSAQTPKVQRPPLYSQQKTTPSAVMTPNSQKPNPPQQNPPKRRMIIG